MLFDVAHQLFQPIQLKFVHQAQHIAQLTFGETLGVVPHNIMFGQIYKVIAFVFTEGHFGMRQFYEQLLLLFHRDFLKALPIKGNFLFNIRVKAKVHRACHRNSFQYSTRLLISIAFHIDYDDNLCNLSRFGLHYLGYLNG